MAGCVVGINTAICSSTGGSHGIGFAIPSNLVKLVVDSAVTGRQRGWLVIVRRGTRLLQLQLAG